VALPQAHFTASLEFPAFGSTPSPPKRLQFTRFAHWLTTSQNSLPHRSAAARDNDFKSGTLDSDARRGTRFGNAIARCFGGSLCLQKSLPEATLAELK